MNKFNPNRKGFTLIELLIVIAVLGTLAVVVLIALNPVQQLARTRDAGRSSTVTQIGRVAESYATVTATYPTGDATWLDEIIASGEIDNPPSPVDYQITSSVPCTTNLHAASQLCYDIAADDFIIFVSAEADSNIARCNGVTGQGTASDPAVAGEAYFVYSSNAGRGGIVCTDGSQPTAPVVTAEFAD